MSAADRQLFAPAPDGSLVPVAVLAIYECGGERLATVMATSGRPFVGGTHWPVRTSYAIIPVSKIIVMPKSNTVKTWRIP